MRIVITFCFVALIAACCKSAHFVEAGEYNVDEEQNNVWVKLNKNEPDGDDQVYPTTGPPDSEEEACRPIGLDRKKRNVHINPYDNSFDDTVVRTLRIAKHKGKHPKKHPQWLNKMKHH